MSCDEIDKTLRIAARLGIRKLKITGGEPLLRGDICEIIARASRYMDEVSLTTNGISLPNQILRLKQVGLDRINVSLDTLCADTHERITGDNEHSKVLSGIEAAAELLPVKLNMVVMSGINDAEIADMIEFAGSHNIALQLIEFEAAREAVSGGIYRRYHHDLGQIEAALEKSARLVERRGLHHRQKYYLPYNSGTVQVEVIRPMHNTEFCMNCSRLRITSDGKIKPCLFDNNCVDILRLIRDNGDDDELMGAVKSAVALRRPYWCKNENCGQVVCRA